MHHTATCNLALSDGGRRCSCTLDADIPHGAPTSPVCRWCGEPKGILRGLVLVCTKCDRRTR